MLQVIMTVGLQASGKSTWARKWVLERPGERKRVNRDDLRAMLDVGTWSPTQEQFTIKVRDSIMLAALRSGCSVVIDDTNLRRDNFTKIVETLRKAGIEAVVMEKMFPIELEEALQRDEKRTPSVGADVIKKTWEKFIGKHGKLNAPRTEVISAASKPVPVSRIDGLPDAIICDLDGTLAHMGDRSPYDATDCDIIDSPNVPVIDCVLAMHRANHRIIFVSGRDQKYRPETQRFIEAYCKHAVIADTTWNRPDNELIEPVPYVLHMRGETNPDPTKADQRKDSVIKQEIFDAFIRGKYNVKFVLDDRNQVVDFWRSIGLTCFQVAEGDF